MGSQQCFARRHMSPGDFAYYSYALAVSRGSGIFYSDDRRDAKEFGEDGISNRTIFDSRKRLEKTGWLVRRQTGRRLKRNPLTGVFESIQYRVLTHAEWIATHPGRCRFTKPDPNIGTGEGTPETPDADSATGPDAISATGEQAPDADSSITGRSFVPHLTQILPSPDADSAAKSSKEREEEREEKGGPIARPLSSLRESPSSAETRASATDQTQRLSLKAKAKKRAIPKRKQSVAKSHAFWLAAHGRGGTEYLKKVGVSAPAHLTDAEFEAAMRHFQTGERVH